MTHPALQIAQITNAQPIRFPSGRWGIVGSGPADLMLMQPDGSPITEEQARAAAHVGPRMAGVRTRTWDSREEVVAALRDRGWVGE